MLLRRWRADDAAALAPVLEANVAHLGDWIPRHVSEPAPVASMAQRLERFGADFDANRAWRYGLFSPDEQTVLGEVSLFPRNDSTRVTLDAADRLEIGYWLRRDATGQGFATEATQAMFDLASTLPGMRWVEIRCESANERSAAVPRRLGFQLADALAAHPGDMVWVKPVR